jgi:hypothetical protein
MIHIAAFLLALLHLQVDHLHEIGDVIKDHDPRRREVLLAGALERLPLASEACRLARLCATSVRLVGQLFNHLQDAGACSLREGALARKRLRNSGGRYANMIGNVFQRDSVWHI